MVVRVGEVGSAQLEGRLVALEGEFIEVDVDFAEPALGVAGLQSAVYCFVDLR